MEESAEDSGVSRCDYATSASSPSTNGSRPPSRGMSSRPSSGNGSLPTTPICSPYDCSINPAFSPFNNNQLQAQLFHYEQLQQLQSEQPEPRVIEPKPGRKLKKKAAAPKLPPIVEIRPDGPIFCCPIIRCTQIPIVFTDIDDFVNHIVDHCPSKLKNLEIEIRPNTLLKTKKKIEEIVKRKTKTTGKKRNPADGKPEEEEKDLDVVEYCKPQFSKGDLKLVYCDKCNENFVCKASLWIHLEDVHLQFKKILWCQMQGCYFTTTYNHHLDYHMKVHKKDKPIKCTEEDCTYRCENKAMLVSHLKSHSDIISFNCRDCTYRSKYKATFTHHLRENRHRCGIIFDGDGKITDIVIDPDSNKRGPRRKKMKTPDSETSIVPAVTQVDPSASLHLNMQQLQNLSWCFQAAFFERYQALSNGVSYPLSPISEKMEDEPEDVMQSLVVARRDDRAVATAEPLDLTKSKSPIDLSVSSSSESEQPRVNKKRKGVPVKNVYTMLSDSEETIAKQKEKPMKVYECKFFNLGCTSLYCDPLVFDSHMKCHSSDPLNCARCGYVAEDFADFCTHLALRGVVH